MYNLSKQNWMGFHLCLLTLSIDQVVSIHHPQNISIHFCFYILVQVAVLYYLSTFSLIFFTFHLVVAILLIFVCLSVVQQSHTPYM